MFVVFFRQNGLYSHIKNTLENSKVISLGYHGDVMKNLLIGIYYYIVWIILILG